mgnify:CR=1 FL=1
MAVFSVRYIHKISPSAQDVGPDIELTEADINSPIRAKLRELKILRKGQRCTHRIEAEGKIVIFPWDSVWHSIILTPKTIPKENP